MAFTRLAPHAAYARLPAKVDAVLCGHSHYDHLLDAPGIALATGAKLIGSRSTCSFGQAAGLPDAQRVEIPAEGGVVEVGEVSVRFVPSLHGRIGLAGVPFPGTAAAAPGLPARVWHYRMGGAFGILLSAPGVSLYHNGSADLIDARLAGLSAEVLLVGLAGRRSTPDYLRRLTAALSPSLIVPTHHDAFFAPLDRGVHLLPGIDLDGFVEEAHNQSAGTRVVTPGYGETLAVPPGDARGAVFTT